MCLSAIIVPAIVLIVGMDIMEIMDMDIGMVNDDLILIPVETAQSLPWRMTVNANQEKPKSKCSKKSNNQHDIKINLNQLSQIFVPHFISNRF